jgi:alpha-tubulin suppressor-like RCC1 family protein
MSTTTGRWTHLPGSHRGHFEVVVATHPAPLPRHRRPRRPGILLPLLVVLAGVLLCVVALQPAPAEARALPRLGGIAQVSTGVRHGCAVLTTGRVRCWGDGTTGALGFGGYASIPHGVPVRNPADTGALTGIRQVATGAEHSCAVRSTGGVLCWGADYLGQLGDGGTQGRPLPVPVKGPNGQALLTGAAAISAGGDNACALLRTGRVVCWGADGEGQVGGGELTPYSNHASYVVDEDGARLSGITQVDTGRFSSCARGANGQAWCWGNNEAGQLGVGTTLPRIGAVAVRAGPDAGPLRGISAVSTGANHACARLASGEARCWGNNQQGRLGDGTDGRRLFPVPVLAATGTRHLTRVTSIQAGAGATCALLATGGVRCWGNGVYGTMGNGTQVEVNLRAVAVRNAALTANLGSVTQITLGEITACARLTDGQARCWGFGGNGATGTGTNADEVPRPRPLLQGPLVP